MALHLQEAESIQGEGVQAPSVSADPSVGADLSVCPAAAEQVQGLCCCTWQGCF